MSIGGLGGHQSLPQIQAQSPVKAPVTPQKTAEVAPAAPQESLKPQETAAMDQPVQTDEDLEVLTEELETAELDEGVPEPEAEETGLEDAELEDLDAEAEDMGVEVEDSGEADELEGEDEVEEEGEVDEAEEFEDVEETEDAEEEEEDPGDTDPDGYREAEVPELEDNDESDEEDAEAGDALPG